MGPFGAVARKYKFASVCLALAIAAVASNWAHLTKAGSAGLHSREQARPERAIYPYSVIPGGVLSNAELRRAVARDRVAADHYRDFAVERAKLEIVPKPRLVYVSYRVADRVYWTRKRILLKQGETILNDGVHQARTRCGNRISDTPQGNAWNPEPDEKTLDTVATAGNTAEDRPQWGPTSEAVAVPVHVPGVTLPGVTPEKYLSTFGPALVSGESAGGGPGAGARAGFGGGGGGQAAGAAAPGEKASGGSASGGNEAKSELPPGNSQPGTAPVPGIAIDRTGVPVPGYYVLPGNAGNSTQPKHPAAPPVPRNPATGYLPAGTSLPVPGSSVETFLMGPVPSIPMSPKWPPNVVPPALLPVENAAHLDITDFVPVVPSVPHLETDRQDASHAQVPEPGTWLEGLLGAALLAAVLTIRHRGLKHEKQAAN